VYTDKFIFNHHVIVVVFGIFKFGKFVQFVVTSEFIFVASVSKSRGRSSEVIRLGTGTI
jgi:hypothetical protein